MDDPDQGKRVNRHISASQVKTHATCQKKYEFRYHTDIEPTKAPSGYGILGKLVHKSIEGVLQERPNERNADRLKGLFKQEFFDLESSGEMDIDYVDEDQRERGLNALEAAAKFIEVKDNDLNGFEIVGLEVKTFFHIDDPAVDSSVLGYMDLCTENEVWDWKTGSIRSTTKRDEIIQGSMYVAGFYEEYGKMPENVRFCYLKENKERLLDPSKENWDRMIGYARKLMESKRRDSFPAEPGKKCHWCEYEMVCPETPNGVGMINEALSEKPELWFEI